MTPFAAVRLHSYIEALCLCNASYGETKFLNIFNHTVFTILYNCGLKVGQILFRGLVLHLDFAICGLVGEMAAGAQHRKSIVS